MLKRGPGLIFGGLAASDLEAPGPVVAPRGRVLAQGLEICDRRKLWGGVLDASPRQHRIAGMAWHRGLAPRKFRTWRVLTEVSD